MVTTAITLSTDTDQLTSAGHENRKSGAILTVEPHSPHVSNDVATILVLDADQASALAVVRSLGRSGSYVDIASTHESPICASSRYSRECLR